MVSVQILFGTESGNAEMVADDIADAFTSRGVNAQVTAMDEYNVDDLPTAEFAIVITSTYGEGDLPLTTAPFHDALTATRPDLNGLRFAAFGLGDSSYETYNNAISVLAGSLAELGANHVGEIGRHDASSGESYSDAAVEWVKSIIDIAAAGCS